MNLFRFLFVIVFFTVGCKIKQELIGLHCPPPSLRIVNKIKNYSNSNPETFRVTLHNIKKDGTEDEAIFFMDRRDLGSSYSKNSSITIGKLNTQEKPEEFYIGFDPYEYNRLNKTMDNNPNELKLLRLSYIYRIYKDEELFVMKNIVLNAKERDDPRLELCPKVLKFDIKNRDNVVKIDDKELIIFLEF